LSACNINIFLWEKAALQITHLFFFLKKRKLPLATQDLFSLIFEPQLHPYHSLRQIGVGLKSYFKITNFSASLLCTSLGTSESSLKSFQHQNIIALVLFQIHRSMPHITYFRYHRRSERELTFHKQTKASLSSSSAEHETSKCSIYIRIQILILT